MPVLTAGQLSHHHEGVTIGDRALLECFYGPLWASDARAMAVRRAAAHGATGYVYGPAADLRTGQRWREPYGDQGGHLANLVETAHSLGLAVTWRVSPGAPLARSAAMSMVDEHDLAVLRQRITEIIGLGFDRVLVAFDDLDTDLDPATRSVFGHDRHPVAAAQAHVLNAVHATVREAGADLLVCPTHYWGIEPSRYRARLGELLDPELAVCWTGITVTSPAIDASQVRRVAEQFQRPIWIWDNFPVNDWDGVHGQFSNEMMPRRLPLAPLRGRAADLDGAIAGYGANAALQARAGLPAVCTALDWAGDPAGYQPDREFRRALAESGDGPALARLADIVGALPNGAPLGELAAAVVAAVCHPDDETLRTLDDLLLHTEHAVGSLAGALGGELEPWLSGLAVVLPASRAAMGVLASGSRGEPPQNQDLLTMRQAIAGWPGVALADGTLRMLVDRALGVAGAGAPAWPDG